MKKTKVLVDARVIGGEGQGAVTYLCGLYNAFHELYGDQYELYFAGYHPDAIYKRFPFLEKHQILKVKSRSRLIQMAWEFPSLIKGMGVEFAHFQYVTPFFKTSNEIVTTHDILFIDFPQAFSWWYRFIRTFLFRISLKSSEVKITVSDYSRQRIVHHFNMNANEIAVTPNAVPSIYFEKYDKEKAAAKVLNKFKASNYILYISRLEKRKNHQLLFNAYEQLNLADQDIQLFIVGNNTLGERKSEQALNRLIKKYPEKVHWVKKVDDEDLLTIYRAARMFVYPSTAEGFGIPPIEAAALRIPTLCSKVTAMSDFSFFNKYLFDPGNMDELKYKMTEMIDTPPSDDATRSISLAIKNKYNWYKSAEILHTKISDQLDIREIEEQLVESINTKKKAKAKNLEIEQEALTKKTI